MNRLIAISVLTLVFACTAWSQSPTPTPAPAEPGEVVKISTNLIQIDVTVRDRKGKVVTDLRQDEIEIYENGKKQEISNFSFISNIKSKGEVETPKEEKDKSTVVLPSSAMGPEQVRRTLALVVDDLTLSFESTYQVRRALKKFVDEQMREGDLVAIIQTGAGVGALQQFTSDKRRLYAAIERVRWNAMGSGDLGAFKPIQRPTGEDADRKPGERTSAEFQREAEDYRKAVLANESLEAIDYIVRGMQKLPGRKSILLLSDGFKIFLPESVTGISESRVRLAVRRLIDQANRASVVIYTMDARGLVYTGLTAADDPNGRSPQELERAMVARRDELFDTQEGLTYLAKQTGGIAIINTNGLGAGIRKILDDQSYYLIGYQPDSESFDPKTRPYNQLDIKVTRPGTEVRFRSGFFGITDPSVVAPPKTVEERMFESLSTPFAANDIPLRLNALFYKPPNFSDTFVRSYVHIPGKELTFTDETNGGKKAVFDIIAAGFGDTGTYVDRVSKTYTLVLTKDAYERAMKQGIVYEFSFPVKIAGAYQFRIALHDHGSDKIGSANQFLEVPNLKKGRLELSGVILDNIPYEDYQQQIAGQPARPGLSDSLLATSLRQFKRGTVLSYGFNIYNARIVGTSPNLSFQTRIFRDGKPIFESSPEPVVPTSIQHGTVAFSSALALGTSMIPGEYILQVIITDNGAKTKANTAVQFVQFDIVD